MESTIQNIAVVGAGAMGAFYASRFFELDPDCVSFLADGERYGRLKDQGINVNDHHYSIPVTSPASSPPPADLVLVAVKNHHMPGALKDMACLVGENTIFLSVMNGIDSEEQLGEAFGMDRVLYAIALGIDSVRENNKVTYTKPGMVYFGEPDNTTLSTRVLRLKELFEKAKIPCDIPQDMIRMLWWKFMINVGVNQASAVLRSPYGVFQKSRDALDLMEQAMWEVIHVAEKAGVALSGEDIENWKKVLAGLGPDGKTSMLQDVEAGRKTEVEIFAAKVMDLGERYHVAVPVNKVLYQIIRVFEASFERL